MDWDINDSIQAICLGFTIAMIIGGIFYLGA